MQYIKYRPNCIPICLSLLVFTMGGAPRLCRVRPFFSPRMAEATQAAISLAPRASEATVSLATIKSMVFF